MHVNSGPDRSASVSLVLPAWNESEVIVKAIAEADAALRLIADDYEIIVVDDGSTDNTSELVAQVAAQNSSVRLVTHNPNRGYGAALRSGFLAATKDLVAFTDADCQFDLTELDRFVLLSKRYDLVCGYRINRKDSALRCLYSRVYNQLVRVLLRTEVRDVDCAMKMFHRGVVKNINITGNGFLVNSEILTQAKQQGYSVVEVGVTHRPRTEGTSTVSISHIPKVLMNLARYWWNAVQFPATTEAASPRATSSQVSDRLAGTLQWIVLAIAAVFILCNLGYPLIDRDETRYAEIPREILTTGNWLVPQLNFQTYYDKPPLLYWLCAISFQCFGVNESAARLIPALAALATIAMTMFFASRHLGKQIGLLSGAVLLLSVGFAFTSRYLLLDGLLTMFVSASLFAAYEAIHTKSFKLSWWIVSAVACGLAFMTKGPLAVVLWLPPVFAFAWLTESASKPKARDYAIFAAIVAAIVMPWFIAVWMVDPNFIREFFYTHNLRRFAGAFHAQPFWYFVPVLLVAGHPWSFLTIPYLNFMFSQKGDVRHQRPPLVGFLLLWSAWCFLFFSMSRCKLPTYLLPAAPALALMMAHYLHIVLHESNVAGGHWFARFWSARSATAATCLAGVGLVTFIIMTGIDVSFSTYVWATLWTVLLVSSLLLLRDHHQAKTAWASSACVAFLFVLMLMHQSVPAYSRGQTLFGEGSPVRDAVTGESQPAIATIAHEFSEVPFYLQRSTIRNFPNLEDPRIAQFIDDQRRTLLIVEDQVTSEQIRSFLPPGTSVKLLAKRGASQIVEVTIPGVERVATRPPDNQAE